LTRDRLSITVRTAAVLSPFIIYKVIAIGLLALRG
jgi:hypothetical protein